MRSDRRDVAHPPMAQPLCEHDPGNYMPRMISQAGGQLGTTCPIFGQEPIAPSIGDHTQGFNPIDNGSLFLLGYSNLAIGIQARINPVSRIEYEKEILVTGYGIMNLSLD